MTDNVVPVKRLTPFGPHPSESCSFWGSHRLLDVPKQIADITQFTPSFDCINEGILKHEVFELRWTLWAAAEVEMVPARKVLLLVSSAEIIEEETTTFIKEIPRGRAFTYRCR